ESPGVIATWGAERAIPLIHYSTDYVFPGSGTQAWSEVDDVAPLNQYGASKLAGERAIADVGAQAIVMRTSWVYDAIGKNFVTTMLRLGRDRTTLSIVADQHGAPTYAPHLARATVDALHLAEQTSSFIPGIYHVCNAGETTWYDFASDIFANARERGIALTVDRLDPIATKDYPTPAARPLNSRLNTQKASDVLNITLPNWRDGLIECMNNYEGQ
ncbi:MAG: dTDP-4-dehydrorhamnose reductase, partial [bacterium]|nr:dTDP-4-dehydrorhamnose reductase [Candidatus Kapabacteria bacterium]